MKKKMTAAIALVIMLAACNSNRKDDHAADLIGFDSSAINNGNPLGDTAKYVSINGVTYVRAEKDNGGVNNASTNPVTKKEVAVKPDSTSTASKPSTTTTNTTTTAPAKKKGWSKAAKGAVIGAGVGAATGAIISKKKGKGAVIGAIIGSGAGYVIGRDKDKKSGRN